MQRVLGCGSLMTTVLLGAVGCSDERKGEEARVVTDSAGVEVVVVRLSASNREFVGVLSREMGVVSGAEELEFAAMTGALQLLDGRVVVADGGSKSLRFFDSDGSFSGSAGRGGEGPGEFQSLDYFGLIGTDTLMVYDARLQRLSIFDASGGFVGSNPVSNVTLPYPVGALDSGALAAWQFYGPEPKALGPHTAQIEFGTFGPAENSFRVLGTAHAAEEAQVQYKGRATRAFRPFSREGDVAAGGRHIYVLSSSADNRIQIHDPEGKPVRVIAINIPRRAPTSADVNAWVESWMEEFQPSSEDVEAWWRFGFREVAPPDSIPLLRSLEVDSGGNVCAERYPLTWDSPAQYWCFSPDGHFVRGIELPPGQARRGPHPYWDPQLQITNDGVVGIWADDLGVERVRIFELHGTVGPPGETNGA